ESGGPSLVRVAGPEDLSAMERSLLREASLADLRALLTPVEGTAGPGADGPTADGQGAPGELGDAPSAPRPIPQQILPLPSDPPGSVALERDLLLFLLCDDQQDGDLEQAVALVCERVPAERRRLVLLLADTSDRQRLRRLQKAGVDGLCALGSRGQGRIYTALHAIATGGSYVDPLFRQRLNESGGPSLVRVAGPEDLSAMERSLLREVCRGYNAPEIAARRGLAANSVRHYLSQTYQRIGVRDRAQAIGWSVVNGVMAVEELQAIYLT
ncbi:MAG: LuxR C-terminal-related transcriptional regulator, partial [Cyanobium sp.]